MTRPRSARLRAVTSNRPVRRLVLPVVVLLAAATAPAAEVVERIVAHVNSRVVTQSLFEARLEQKVREEGPPANATRAEEMRKALFNELINEALLEDRARDLDLITNDKEIEDQIKRLKEQNKVTTDEEFEKALEASGLTVDRLRDQLRNASTLQRVVGREVQSKVDLSDDALRVIYEREKETYRIPEKAHLAEILILRGSVGPEERVRAAVEALRGGAKFEAVVKQYSDGATKDRGGDLGWVTRGELLPEIDRTVFSLPANAVSDPIVTKIGWHLVRILEKAPVSYRPFSEVKGDILKREQESQFQKKLAEYLEKLKRDAVIRVAPEMSAYYTPPVVAVRELSSGEGTPSLAEETSGAGSSSRSPRGVEITASGGYRFGGTTTSYGNNYIDRVGIPSAPSFGASVEIPVSDTISVEVLWSHQDTELRLDFSGLTAPGASGERRLSHLNVDTFQAGVLVQSGSPIHRLRLYGDLLLGASLLTPAPEFSSRTRFSLSIGGGVKFWASDHFGARFGIRWMPVYLSTAGAGYSYCDPYYGCYAYYDTNFLSQGDVHVGVSVKF